jgi:hypothetical protein
MALPGYRLGLSLNANDSITDGLNFNWMCAGCWVHAEAQPGGPHTFRQALQVSAGARVCLAYKGVSSLYGCVLQRVCPAEGVSCRGCVLQRACPAEGVVYRKG